MILEKDGRWITSMIVKFSRSEENSTQNANNDPAWADPIVGFSRGDDPIYQFFKQDIGDFYWTPQEIFKLTYPDTDINPNDLSIISWILPHTEKTKADNSRENMLPSEAWSRVRIYGEEFNMKLAKHIVAVLSQRGYKALVPVLSPLWGWQNSNNYGFASNWSERHTAYASGLGTFGLCDGLITRKGKAFRCGSVVANIIIPPTQRDYKGYRENCLFYQEDGLCGKCIERCPVGAITKDGHDKTICKNYLWNVVEPYSRQNFGFQSYACGLCQTGVPCESRIPTRRVLRGK